MKEGWIKLFRKISDNALWLNKPFSKGQAWVDLILLANHKYNFFYLRDHKIEVQRGEIGWSELKLSERWGWSRNKLRKFLNDLEKEQQIKQQKSKSCSIIQILNYERYQEKGQQQVQQQDNSRYTNKNDKNKKNIKYFKDSDINSAFIDYLEIRKKIKCQNTERVIKRLKKKLREYSKDQKSIALEIIEKAITSNWKDFYPL